MFESDAVSEVLSFLLTILAHIMLVIPCWILALRRNVAPHWIHWVIPYWNLFTAYKVGKGALKDMLITIVPFFVLCPLLIYVPGGVVAFAMAIGNGFEGMSLMVALTCILFFLSIVVYGLLLSSTWKWAKNISVLAGFQPIVLGVLLAIVPIGVPVVCGLFSLDGLISLRVAVAISLLTFVLAWVAFLVIALRTPKVGCLVDSV